MLELGAGTGRVTLDLAELGHEVVGLDLEPELVAALEQRARARSLPASGAVGDVRSFELDGGVFALIVAPMQVVQLLGSASDRAQMLAAVRAHIEPGGTLALALADPLEGVPDGPIEPPLPDVLERDGWVYSSTPTGIHQDERTVSVERVREAVSPSGALTRSGGKITLERLESPELEREAEAAGYRVRPRRRVAPTPDYVGTTVVVLEAPS